MNLETEIKTNIKESNYFKYVKVKGHNLLPKLFFKISILKMLI